MLNSRVRSLESFQRPLARPEQRADGQGEASSLVGLVLLVRSLIFIFPFVGCRLKFSRTGRHHSASIRERCRVCTHSPQVPGATHLGFKSQGPSRPKPIKVLAHRGKASKGPLGQISTSRVWSSSSAAVCGTCVVVVPANGYSCFPKVARNVCWFARLRQTTHVTGLGWHTALWSCWHGVCSADHRQTAVLWFRRSNKPTIKTHPGRSMLKRSLRLIVRTLRDSRESPCERVAWRDRDHVSGSPGAPRDRLPQS